MQVISKQEIGSHGEERAAWFYRLRGYQVVARNVRTRAGELDLIVRRGNTLAFVEVKTRHSLAAGHGYDAVNQQKRLRIIRLATQWLATHPHAGEIRYDVVSLDWNGHRFELTHIPDAFRPVADVNRPWRWAAA
jgi:putative endonuclease